MDSFESLSYLKSCIISLSLHAHIAHMYVCACAHTCICKLAYMCVHIYVKDGYQPGYVSSANKPLPLLKLKDINVLKVLHRAFSSFFLKVGFSP